MKELARKASPGVQPMIRLTPSDRWYVYGLYEEPTRPFYVGMAKNPVTRGAQHMVVAGYIRDRIRTVIGKGGVVSIGIIADVATLAEAREREIYEIGHPQGLINKMGRGLWARRTRTMPIEQMMEPVARVLKRYAEKPRGTFRDLKAAALLEEGAEK